MDVKQLRTTLNLSQAQFAAKIGVPRDRVAKWETGKASPKHEDSLKIKDLIESNRELVHDLDDDENIEAPSISEAKQKEVITLGKHAPLRLTADEYGEAFGDWQGLPIYNEPITASFVMTFRDSKVHRPQYYLHDPRFKDCDFGAVITGDSMHPEIRHGDIVACKLISDKTFIVFGDIYYVVASNGLETCKYVQRVKRVIDGAERRGKGTAKYSRYDESDIVYDDTQVLLVPYNTSIDPSPILKEMIEKLYKVRGIIRGY